MNDSMNAAMLGAWLLWHNHIDDEDVPPINASFREGFEAAHSLFLPLLTLASIHVYTAAEAEHMLDGFTPKRRGIDALVDQIKKAISP